MKISRNKVDLLTADRGMTGKQLAATAGISRQSLSTIKTRGTCTALSAIKIARALGVDVTEIMEEVEQA